MILYLLKIFLGHGINFIAASYMVSKTSRTAASFGIYNPEKLNLSH